MSTTSTDDSEGSPFPKYLSPSQITSLLMCGEQFRLNRKLKVPERPMWASIGGSTVHRVTEILDKKKWYGEHSSAPLTDHRRNDGQEEENA